MQIYSDPTRAADPNALPDIEVFYRSWGSVWAHAHLLGLYSPDNPWTDGDGEPLGGGWYWWTCLPGCMPDSDPFGPFETEAEAIADAQSQD